MYRECEWAYILSHWSTLLLKIICFCYFVLGFLSSCCSQDLYDSILTLLLNNLKTDGSSLVNTRTFIQCIGAIRWVWFGFGLF